MERQQRETERLKQEIARLREELEAASRAAKRQAAPFSQGKPEAESKPSGRHLGDPYGKHR